MNSIQGLIVRLERAEAPDRRLDAEVAMTLLAPPGAVICVDEDIDGWGVDFAPDEHGDSTPWMWAADMLYATRHLDAAQELIAEARPHDAAAVMARALRNLASAHLREDAEAFAGRAARVKLVELLRTVAAERAEGMTQAA